MPNKEQVHNPIFARFYARTTELAEAKGASEHRDELLAGLSGRVIEVGAGTGANVGHYPESVTEVIAVEPEPYLRHLAEGAAAQAPLAIKVIDGVADDLPAQDDEFDAGVASLVLCSVPDQLAALWELHRAIRAGGDLRFYEHVRSPKPGFARLQRALDVVWPFFGGGCHTSRDTTSTIEAAGFTIEDTRRFSFRPCLAAAPVSPHVIGIARRAAATERP
jgi:ubiquinone/menaquinone biosynthesis C-methylase UbiE